MTKLLRSALIVGIVLALTVSWKASAAPFTPQLEADYAFAERWWGTTPTGCLSIDRELVPRASIDGHSGWATIPEWGQVPCVIEIAEGLHPACAELEVVLHEYGHLLGYHHSEDPANIMNANGVPGTLCRAEQLKDLKRSLHRIEVRCQRKKLRVELKECQRNERYWRRMVREAREAA